MKVALKVKFNGEPVWGELVYADDELVVIARENEYLTVRPDQIEDELISEGPEVAS